MSLYPKSCNTRFLNKVIFFGFAIFLFLNSSYAKSGVIIDGKSWSEIMSIAKDTQVNFYTWNTDAHVDNYIAWSSEQLQKRFKIKLKHIKIDEINDEIHYEHSLPTLLKTHQDIDLLWIEKDELESLKQNNVLYGPFVKKLPSWSYVNSEDELLESFTKNSDGFTAPWGISKFSLVYNKATMPFPPGSTYRLLVYSERNPNRITYPAPPDDTGVLFLSILLSELAKEEVELEKEVSLEALQEGSEPLWRYLDQIHPHLWKKGESFPKDNDEMFKLFSQNQIDLAMTLYPRSIETRKANKEIDNNVETALFKIGTLVQVHSLGIPNISQNKEGAMVVINFLLTPFAQYNKENNHVWGDLSVVSQTYKSDQKEKCLVIEQPHKSWRNFLTEEWIKRYKK